MLERVLRACLTSNGALMRGMSMSLFRKKFKKRAKRVLSTYLKIQTPNFKRIQFKHPPNSYDFLNLRTPSISRFSCILPYLTAFAPYHLHLRSGMFCRFFVPTIYIIFQIFFLEKMKLRTIVSIPKLRYFLQMHQRRIIIYIYSFVSSI